MVFSSAILAGASLLTVALARTDLTGCTSTDVSSPAGASVAWYVPGTGELCDFLDCGGGMAPPKTTVPGCPLYSGTATYSPSYLPGYGSMSSAAAASSTSYGAPDMTTSLAVVPTLASTPTAETSLPFSEPVSSDASGTAGYMTTLTTSAPVVGHGNMTAPSVRPSGGNGTSSPASSSLSAPASQTTNGAMSSARVGVAGLVGLGALVAML